MTTAVSATKDEFRALYNKGPHLVWGKIKDFSEKTVHAKSSFIVFMVLIYCWHVTILSL